MSQFAPDYLMISIAGSGLRCTGTLLRTVGFGGGELGFVGTFFVTTSVFIEELWLLLKIS